MSKNALVILFLISLIPGLSLRLAQFREPARGLYGTVFQHDIYHHWWEAGRIREGVNPYSRVLSSDRIHNDKYPGYFPLLYLIGAALLCLGIQDFDSFVVFVKALALFAELGVTALLFIASRRRDRELLGITASWLWFCNRWTLYSFRFATFDTVIIALIFLSACLLHSRRHAGWFLFGLSLSLKQLGILALPLFVMRQKGAAGMIAAIAAVLWLPLALSLPFIADDAHGFFLSLGYDGIRMAVTHGAPDFPFAASLGYYGGLSRTAVALSLLACYGVSHIFRINLFVSTALVYFSFLCFNPVVFNQYFAYCIPFALMALFQEGVQEDPERYYSRGG